MTTVEEPVAPPDHAPLAKQTLAYGLSGFLGPLVGLVTLPIFARVFTRGEYGVFEIGTTLSSAALAVADAGFTAAAMRSYYDYRQEDDTERRSVLFTAFVSTMAVAIGLTALLLALRTDLSKWLFGTADEIAIVTIIAATIPVANAYRFIVEVLRLRLQANRYLVVTVIGTIATSALSVVVVLTTDLRVKGVFLASLVGTLIAVGYGSVVVRKAVSGSFSRFEGRRMLLYGLPLVPASLSLWALALIDRVILARLRNVADVGEYAIANRLASLLVIGMTAFLLALSPFLYSIYSEDPDKERAARARTLTYLTFILCFSGLALTLFAREVIDILAPKFHDAYKAVGPLALGTAVYGLSGVLGQGISLSRRTVHFATLTLLAAAVNIGLNFALIPPLGFVGAGIATAIGYAVLAVAYYIVGQRVYPTPYEPRKVIGMFAIASLLGAFGFYDYSSYALALPIKIAALAAFVAAVWVSRAMTTAEFVELRRFVLGMVHLRSAPPQS